MKRIFLSAAVVALGVTSLATAQQLAPIPAPDFNGAPYAETPYEVQPFIADQPPAHYDWQHTETPPPGYIAPPVPHYAMQQQTHARVPVQYKDLKNRHPCAVSKTLCIGTVCGPVLIDVCVPPYCQPKIKYKRKKIVYDFGKYEVEIHDRKDKLVVDYDD